MVRYNVYQLCETAVGIIKRNNYDEYTHYVNFINGTAWLFLDYEDNRLDPAWQFWNDEYKNVEIGSIYEIHIV